MPNLSYLRASSSGNTTSIGYHLLFILPETPPHPSYHPGYLYNAHKIYRESSSKAVYSTLSTRAPLLFAAFFFLWPLSNDMAFP